MDTQNKSIVNLTDSAKGELKRLLEKEPEKKEGVRLSLLAGGCSGLSYHLEFDNKKEKDLVDDSGDIKIIVDTKSALYINGLTVDYQGGLTGKGFVFTNPNATKSCGCGTSFSVGDKDITLEFKKNTNSNICPSSQNQT